MNVITPEITAKLRGSIQLERLLNTAVSLVEVPSPTRSAGAVADRLHEILAEDGFPVERPVAGWPDAPAVVARWNAGAKGRTLQFNGHLDTVHLPFVPPRVEDGILYGSGSSDMKGGIAAMVEAMRAIRDAGVLNTGALLLTAHDLHETPWGDGSQVNALIDSGFVGDGVLLPEYLSDRLPVIGRGLAVLEIMMTREGDPVHEVLGGIDQPSVILAGSRVIQQLSELDQQLARLRHPMAGRESIFVGQIASGEIFNQAPSQLSMSGTRRWLPGTTVDEVKQQYNDILSTTADEMSIQIDGKFQLARDAFELPQDDPLTAAVQAAHRAATGQELPVGAKPFVDDGNAFVQLGGVSAVTHGPAATGAHTLNESCPVDELMRVALVYALTAVAFCGSK